MCPKRPAVSVGFVLRRIAIPRIILMTFRTRAALSASMAMNCYTVPKCIPETFTLARYGIGFSHLPSTFAVAFCKNKNKRSRLPEMESAKTHLMVG